MIKRIGSRDVFLKNRERNTAGDTLRRFPNRQGNLSPNAIWRFSIPYFAMFVLFLLQPSVLFAQGDQSVPDGPSGEFVVVALRMASEVESTPLGADYTHLIGQVVSFDDPKTWLNGRLFDGTRFVMSDVAIVDIGDPNLSDVTIPPLPISRAENRLIMGAMQIVSDGKAIETLLMVDKRVLVVPAANGALNVILEKPLDPEEVQRLQIILKNTNNYQGEISGVMDRATRDAVATYAEYRGSVYRFADPVISENLVAGMNVLNNDW